MITRQLVLFSILAVLFTSSQEAQAQRRGSIRYSAPRSGIRNPVYNGLRTPYTGRSTPTYTGQRTPARTGRPANLPTVGDRVTTLPIRNRRAYFSGGYYYYYNGFYYQDLYATQDSGVRDSKSSDRSLPQLDNSKRYEVVVPEEGTVIDELPIGTQQVKRGLYQHRDIYYRPAYHEGEVNALSPSRN